ncbi:MAG: hypothetical protein M3Q99_20130 [Acidobacteriota bacterium]|nr:hypothetical protein [Acidobacteriota bacterium]
MLFVFRRQLVSLGYDVEFLLKILKKSLNFAAGKFVRSETRIIVKLFVTQHKQPESLAFYSFL